MTLLELETGGMWRGAALEEGGMCQAAAGRGTGLVWAGAAKSVQCGLGWVAGTQVEGGLGGAILGVILNGLWFCFIMCCILFGRFILLMSLLRLRIKLALVS